MLLFIVDAGRDETIIHRVDWEQGKYLPPKRLRGDLLTQANDLFWMVGRDRCTKIVFDTMGIGRGLAENFGYLTLSQSSGFKVDEKGNVIHFQKEEPKKSSFEGYDFF